MRTISARYPVGWGREYARTVWADSDPAPGLRSAMQTRRSQTAWRRRVANIRGSAGGMSIATTTPMFAETAPARVRIFPRPSAPRSTGVPGRSAPATVTAPRPTFAPATRARCPSASRTASVRRTGPIAPAAGKTPYVVSARIALTAPPQRTVAGLAARIRTRAMSRARVRERSRPTRATQGRAWRVPRHSLAPAAAPRTASHAPTATSAPSTTRARRAEPARERRSPALPPDMAAGRHAPTPAPAT